MGTFQVTCVNKPDRNSKHEHITHIGNTANNWRMTRDEAIARIDDQRDSFYTLDNFGNRADVKVVRPAAGHAYLRTYADGKWTDNLLALAECSGACKLIG